MSDYIERVAAKEKSCDLCRWEGTSNCSECEHPIDDVPSADAVSRKEYEEILKAAKAMHTWIFLHTMDESEAYDECGLSAEMNALLGSAGSLKITQKNNSVVEAVGGAYGK